MAAKEKEKLTDDPCSSDAHETVCNSHQQPLIDCANQRLRYVKMAREMDARSMASARTWQKIANARIAERNGLASALREVKLDLSNVCPQPETCGRHACKVGHAAFVAADNVLRTLEKEICDD